jgi:hypothetical protein
VRAALEEARRYVTYNGQEAKEQTTRHIIAALAALDRLERSAAPEGRHWRHVTSGMLVSEIGRGRMQTDHQVGDMTPVVIYHHAGEHGVGGTFWVRPVREFEDGFVELLLAETGGKP